MDYEERRVTVRSREEFERALHSIELLYVEGVRSIRIEMEEPLTSTDLERINEVLRRLPGFEISFCTPRNIVLQDVMDSTPEDIFKLIYEATRGLFDKVLEAVENEDAVMAEAIEDAHENVHRYAQRFRRQISQSPKKTKALFERAGYVSLLERVADYLAHTAHAVARRGLSGGVKIEVVRVMRMVKELFESAMEAYRRRERGKTDAILRAEDFLQKEIKRLMEKAMNIPDRLAKLSAEATLIHMHEILRGVHQVVIDLLKSE
ncbi:MAG: hypothetical protein QXW47_05330 [Candidatus Jordarchaeales archaeon]|nr:hypothetical protein [Candidatus Jordarchaeia archaeon]